MDRAGFVVLVLSSTPFNPKAMRIQMYVWIGMKRWMARGGWQQRTRSQTASGKRQAASDRLCLPATCLQSPCEEESWRSRGGASWVALPCLALPHLALPSLGQKTEAGPFPVAVGRSRADSVMSTWAATGRTRHQHQMARWRGTDPGSSVEEPKTHCARTHDLDVWIQSVGGPAANVDALPPLAAPSIQSPAAPVHGHW